MSDRSPDVLNLHRPIDEEPRLHSLEVPTLHLCQSTGGARPADQTLLEPHDPATEIETALLARVMVGNHELPIPDQGLRIRSI